MEGVELEFRDEALRAVARKAMQRKTGARGLRTILGNCAARHHVRPAVACATCRRSWSTRPVIEGQTKPYIVYRSDETRLASVDEPRRASGSNHH